ncbi:MAG: ATP-binding cassette domain-containing protein [Bacilli bacterium]|nr:ATP-binding cassette domain-containing protein [Bacilli bacterium]
MIKNDHIITVSNLHKSYKEIHAVKGINFYVKKGDLFAFLGPNGAGKSTTIDILTTILQSDMGNVEIDGFEIGKDDFKIKELIGVVFQDKVLDDLLTVKENMLFRGSLYGFDKDDLHHRVEQALKMTNLEEIENRRYKELSGGQRRRVDIARALINLPKILFLDEPTTGLDPMSRQQIWRTIEFLRKKHGMTIFLTTHYMEEADNADYVVVIVEGEIAAFGTPTELKNEYSHDILMIKPDDVNLFSQKLTEETLDHTIIADFVKIILKNSLEAVPIINRYEKEIISFSLINGSMDDAFLTITGKGIEEYD